ncbi:PREDICTED: uncharacterized protein LOC105557263, partial [Vollenhovia emeryi]|uniref:uncharacterized protein LOC105557263 n=1 Tax=Vollenhovia emeryi TaxID=411798 RepID=UPI0005F37480
MGNVEMANRTVFKRTVPLFDCRWHAVVPGRAVGRRGAVAASEAYRRWQRDNARAAQILGTTLEEEAALHVRKKTDAKEIWDTLVSVFEQSSLQRLYTLLDSFFEMSKDDATSVTKHTSRLANVFENILNELHKGNPNATLPLPLLHHRIFKTLGPEYQYYRSTWYRIPENEQTTKLLIENLRSIENLVASHGTPQTTGAFYARPKVKNLQKKPNKSTPDPASTEHKKEKRSCLYCKKVGHIIANCQKRDSKPGTFFATGLAVNADFAPADSWISDSGTTHHMSTNKQYFATFEKFPIPQRVQTAGKEYILAYGSGRIDVEMRIGDRWLPASMKDV